MDHFNNAQDFHRQGSNNDDEDDVEVEYALFAMPILVLLDTNSNGLRRRRIRDNALTDEQWVIELINGHIDRIFEKMHMEVPQFLTLRDLLLQRRYWILHPIQRVGIHESIVMAIVCISYDER